MASSYVSNGRIIFLLLYKINTNHTLPPHPLLPAGQYLRRFMLVNADLGNLEFHFHLPDNLVAPSGPSPETGLTSGAEAPSAVFPCAKTPTLGAKCRYFAATAKSRACALPASTAINQHLARSATSLPDPASFLLFTKEMECIAKYDQAGRMQQ